MTSSQPQFEALRFDSTSYFSILCDDVRRLIRQYLHPDVPYVRNLNAGAFLCCACGARGPLTGLPFQRCSYPEFHFGGHTVKSGNYFSGTPCYLCEDHRFRLNDKSGIAHWVYIRYAQARRLNHYDDIRNAGGDEQYLIPNGPPTS